MKNITFKLSLGLVVATILAFSLRNPVGINAQYSSSTEGKTISVDKKVRYMETSTSSSTFFDNIDKSQKIFDAGNLVEFSIRVENTGDEVLTQIQAEDVLPSYLDLIFYPGTYNNSSNTLHWKIDSLQPAESKTYYVRAKIASVASDSAETKLTNWVEVQANGVNNTDTASFYVGKSIIPNTGDNTLLIKTAAVLVIVAGAFALRKYARGF